jgi:hypothetical protein
MVNTIAEQMLIADRIWIATALLHQERPELATFTKDEIRHKLKEEGLDEGVKEGSINAHLKEHLIANVAPSSGKYRMLFEARPGRLRLFRSGDLTHPGRIQPRKPSKSVPLKEEIPTKYWSLLDWYEDWNGSQDSSGTVQRDRPSTSSVSSYDDDPLIRLVGSGRHIWADEHADEYVARLRSEGDE